jgi:hypothetical protein
LWTVVDANRSSEELAFVHQRSNGSAALRSASGSLRPAAVGLEANRRCLSSFASRQGPLRWARSPRGAIRSISSYPNTRSGSPSSNSQRLPSRAVSSLRSREIGSWIRRPPARDRIVLVGGLPLLPMDRRASAERS